MRELFHLPLTEYNHVTPVRNNKTTTTIGNMHVTKHFTNLPGGPQMSNDEHMIVMILSLYRITLQYWFNKVFESTLNFHYLVYFFTLFSLPLLGARMKVEKSIGRPYRITLSTKHLTVFTCIHAENASPKWARHHRIMPACSCWTSSFSCIDRSINN